MRLAYTPFILRFKEPAGTSRGIMLEKPTCLLKLWDEKNPEICGYGEAAVFSGLSPEANSRFEYKVVELLANVALGRPTNFKGYSSLLYGFEQALCNLSAGGGNVYFPSTFTTGQTSVTINGLIWMGSHAEMKRRLEEKVAAGFRCIKIKIGAIDWEQEVELIREARAIGGPETEIRVDANGAFSPVEAPRRLEMLARLGVHSIEQPIAAGQPKEMATLCRAGILPIALDEELIGIYETEEKIKLLDTIKPSYLILKPALCYGFSGADEWIRLAHEHNVGWWATSALESNIGLCALAQWDAAKSPSIPQGLGTGALFEENFDSPLELHGPCLSFNPEKCVDRTMLRNLDWRQ